MTIESYKKWKAGEPIIKAKSVIDFYKTNPTFEQERIRSKQIVSVGIVGILCGMIGGFGLGFMIGISL